jgi:hypothetical protein
MRTPRVRSLAAVGALALIGIAPVAACGSQTLNPLPVPAASAEPADTTARSAGAPSASASVAHSPPPATGRTTPRRPVQTKPVRPTTAEPPTSEPSRSCYGAIRFDLDLQNTELELIKSMCFRAGGVLRLQGIGPGLVTATPTSLVSSSYAGGVVDLRFLRPGTVTVTIPQEEKTYTITVVVIR